ncbi:MAG: hypothetical protein EBT90_01380 [Rhodobacteraceae bacterium]|jgi:hypothetical protein|nr:hypothetical protein [Paracoccaceae bacterium]
MFTIEHEFDCTVITVLDENVATLKEDIVVTSFEDCVTIEQFDPRNDNIQKVTLSLHQLKELAAAINLPEGVYHIE